MDYTTLKIWSMWFHMVTVTAYMYMYMCVATNLLVPLDVENARGTAFEFEKRIAQGVKTLEFRCSIVYYS